MEHDLERKRPLVIQGGMGAGVSSWTLARAVSRAGQLGVVAGTALDVILARRLQLGDPGGHMRRALSYFPKLGTAARIVERYFIRGGKASTEPFLPKPVPSARPSAHLTELTVAASFAEVFLAKEGHAGLVGINFLEKIQVPTLPALFGAMLAGVDFVLMGAGIPKSIPGILDGLAAGEAVELSLDVQGAGGGSSPLHFNPTEFLACEPPELRRPEFLAIVSSHTLAAVMCKRSSGRVDGFIVEGPTAGGHNAPPRGQLCLSAEGEPVYGSRDVPDLAAIKALGLPFWLAGSQAEPQHLASALAAGAEGIQVGTAFAYCMESGLAEQIKSQVLQLSRAGKARVFTDPLASPTGFPFKLVNLPGQAPADRRGLERPRICDLGYLRQAYTRENGQLGWRCPSEPVDDYVRKGGSREETVGRKCICNGLLANIGLGQTRQGGIVDAPLLTSGDDVASVYRFLKPGAQSYSAVDVLDYLLVGQVEEV